MPSQSRTQGCAGCFGLLLLLMAGPVVLIPAARMRFAAKVLGIQPSFQKLVSLSRESGRTDALDAWATARLVRVRSAEAIPELLRIIRQYRQYDFSDGIAAAETLIEIADAKVAPELLEMLRRDSGDQYDVRNNTRATRALIGLESQSVIKPLLALGDAGVDTATARYLISGRWVAQRLADVLLSETDKSLRADAAGLLGAANDTGSVRQLVQAFDSERDVDVRQAIVLALASKQSPLATATLLRGILPDQPLAVRRASVHSLYRSDSTVATPRLIGMYWTERESDVRFAIVSSLCWRRSQAERPALIAAMLSESTEVIRITATECLRHRKDRSLVPEFVEALKRDGSLKVRLSAMNAVMPFKTTTTDHAVAVAFRRDDELRRIEVVAGLQAYGWAPQTNRQRVYWWVTSRDREALNANWDTTSEVLLADVVSAEPAGAAYAMEAFVALGRDEIIAPLLNALRKHGTITLAEVYLNCGNDILEEAGERWVYAHGYSIQRTPGSGKVRWGSLR